MYSILQSKDGELVLIIEPQDCAPDGPMFIYDGGDTALLFRDWFSNVKLQSVGTAARQPLVEAKEIHVLEKSGDDIVRDYIAPVRIVHDVKSLMM